MTEKIGNVTLDYSKYSGEDLYCDGAVEDELLQIAKDMDGADYPRVIEERESWPVLYHLSELRENIVEWLPMKEDAKVLEVGSGCGAITGMLSRKAGNVTCVELSKKRSMINAYRHKDCDNITIHVGNFKDIEPGLSADYDYIFLIGVLEYADSYIGGETPYEDFLGILKRHLAAEGRLVIAIENQYGLKYFAGCREDHTGVFFEGIEGYPVGKGVRTFGRESLTAVLKEAGIKEFHFYYPYPDYKFMTSLYSDDHLPKEGELSDNLRNFDRDRLMLFDEKHAFDGVIKEGQFPFFSNSFLVVTGQKPSTQYVRYSNERAPEYAISTKIMQGSDGALVVRKYPMCSAARQHICGSAMAKAYQELSARYAGGALSVNRCLSDQNGREDYAEFSFVRGDMLSRRMDEKLFGHDIEGFYALFREYVKRVSYRNEVYQGSLSSIDLIFSNILVDGDQWTLIDYEWTSEEAQDMRLLIYKAVYCYLLEDERRNVLDRTRMLQELSMTDLEAAQVERQETEFQRKVSGGRASLAQIREKIGNPVTDLAHMIQGGGSQSGDTGVRSAFQVYEDRGEGFREEQSYFIKGLQVVSGELQCEITIPREVNRVRLDPGSRCCAIKLREISLMGKAFPLRDEKLVTVNGTRLKSSDVILFDTEDPNITIDLTKGQREKAEQGAETLRFRACVDILSAEMTEELIRAKRPFF